MMKFMFWKGLFTVLIAIGIAGCATPKADPAAEDHKLPAVSEGQARVVFLRQSSVFQSGKPVELQINGAVVAKLKNRDYTYVDLPAGEHYFVVTVFPHTGAFRSGLTLKENDVRFLIVRPDTRQDNRRPLFRDSRRFDLDGGQFNVQEIGPDSGEEYRRAMRYRALIAKPPANFKS